MLSKFPRTIVFLCAAGLAAIVFAATAQAEDSYYRVRINDLKFTEGELPKESTQDQWRFWRRVDAMQPYAVLDGSGEIYVGTGDHSRRLVNPWDRPWPQEQQLAVFIRAPKGGDVSGRLYYPKSDWTGMAALKFTIPASEGTSSSESKNHARRGVLIAQRSLFQRPDVGAMFPAEPGIAMKFARPKWPCTNSRAKLRREMPRSFRLPQVLCSTG